MQFAMIVNPHAGKKQGDKVSSEAAEWLAARDHGITILRSSKPGETVSLARNLNHEGLDGIIAVGGDGTMFEVINGLLLDNDEIPVPVGQIPVGTGNSFLKDVELHSVEDALKAIDGGHSREVDLGRFHCGHGDYYFINLLGSGFVSNVAYRAKKYKFLGSLSYILAVLEELVFLKSIPLELTVDGRLYRRDAVFTEVCNSRFTGGDMLMAPEGSIDDGLLDVVVMSKVTRWNLLRLFPAIFTGKHVEDPSVEVFKGREIEIKTAKPLLLTPDGETFGTTPLSVKVLNRKIRIFC